LIRIGAVGDLHMSVDSIGRSGRELAEAAEDLDMLLLTGDLTRCSTLEEAHIVAGELKQVTVPTITVLGNHDYHSDQEKRVTAVLEDAGITVLECSGTVLICGGRRLGIAGAKGFGGGFAGRCASEFGEPEMKAFIRTTCRIADRLGEELRALADCDALVALTHYAPVPDTLAGEPLEIYPFLGSYLLGQAIDSAPTSLAVHGHAHAGTERGTTPGGVRVRNVAHPVIKQAYSVFHLEPVRRMAEPVGATGPGSGR
jgi:Icc-related predicted phosphoesterase